MSEISFEENKYKVKSRSIFGQAEVPKMITFLTNKGIVKNERQAKAVLLGLTACFFIASVVVFMVFVLDVRLFNRAPTPTPEQIQKRQENRERFEKLKQESQNSTNNTTNPQ